MENQTGLVANVKEMRETMEVPDILYKYLPCQYVEQFLTEGIMLFRNLTYFRQYEDKIRGDQAEGIHVDHPDNPMTIRSLDRPISVTGDFSFLNSIEQDKVYVFCLSTVLEYRLFEEFGTECCIVIEDVPTFLLRCRGGIMRSPTLSKCDLLHRQVDYYRCNEVTQRSVKDPKNLPFFKDAQFMHQCEYRLVLGLKGSFTLKRCIVDNKIFNFRQEIQNGRPSHRIIRVGSLEDIARVVRKQEMVG